MVDALYFAIASCSGALGGVVGWALQLRNLRKAHLEIEDLERRARRAEQETEKLRLEVQDLRYRVDLTRLSRDKTELEVEKLRREQAPKATIVTDLTHDEVARFGRPAPMNRDTSMRISELTKLRSPIRIALAAAVVALTIVSLVLEWPELRKAMRMIGEVFGVGS